MVIRKISYYRVIVSLCLFMFLLSPVFGDENSAVSFDKELPENNIVTIQPDSLRILHNPLTGWVLYASMGVDAADFWACKKSGYGRFRSRAGQQKFQGPAYNPGCRRSSGACQWRSC